jgi:hypothetical protein
MFEWSRHRAVVCDSVEDYHGYNGILIARCRASLLNSEAPTALTMRLNQSREWRDESEVSNTSQSADAGTHSTGSRAGLLTYRCFFSQIRILC